MWIGICASSAGTGGGGVPYSCLVSTVVGTACWYYEMDRTHLELTGSFAAAA